MRSPCLGAGYSAWRGRHAGPRPGDLDGRGQRSERFLVEWIEHFIAVCLDRRDFAAMTGLGEPTASSLIAALLKRALVRSDTPRGPLRFAVPLHALRLLFPNLWPEAEADAAAADSRR